MQRASVESDYSQYNDSLSSLFLVLIFSTEQVRPLFHEILVLSDEQLLGLLHNLLGFINHSFGGILDLASSLVNLTFTTQLIVIRQSTCRFFNTIFYLVGERKRGQDTYSRIIVRSLS